MANNKKTHTKPLSYFMADKPEWMTEEAVITLMRGYLLEDETPNQLYERLAKAAANYYQNGIGRYSREDLEAAFLYAFLKGWLSPATPVAANLGAGNKSQAVSCFGVYVENSIEGIFNSVKEAALLSKAGGGLGINLSDIEGMTSPSQWAKFFDLVGSVVSQSGVRRGAVAIYLKFSHSGTEEFLNSKDLLHGDVRQKLDCNIAVIMDDDDMDNIKKRDPRALRILNKILELRMKFGSPYIQYIGNCHRQDPEAYKALGMSSGASQLCNEIIQFHDKDHSYTCVLSSLNASKTDEWKDFEFAPGLTLPMLGIFFLDAVNEDFIQRGQHIRGLENSVRSAIKGRALGLGVLGLHSYYLSHMMPWKSVEAMYFNSMLAEYIDSESLKGSKYLAKYLGEPEWLKGTGERNIVRLANAPTTTNSLLCNAGSPGIEPVFSFYYSVSGAKGSFTRQDKHLIELLNKKGKNTGSVWASIREHGGSVQHLPFLTEFEKEVFKTSFEIDQFAIITQASDRQKFIDQGQSLNLFFSSEADAQYIMDVHLEAYKQGIKGLYYLRSDSMLQNEMMGDEIDFVYMETRPDCIYCQKAKELLANKGIFYIEEYKPDGKVPRIWLKGELLDDGYNSLKKRFLDDSYLPSQQEADCVACEG